jgi:hypothetical protein
MQGYFFGKPLSADALETFLGERKLEKPVQTIAPRAIEMQFNKIA